jgi:hypothetical protein
MSMKTREQGEDAKKGTPIPFRKKQFKVRPITEVLTYGKDPLANVVPLMKDLVLPPDIRGVESKEGISPVVEAANDEPRVLCQTENTLLESWLQAFHPIPRNSCEWSPNMSKKQKEVYRERTERSERRRRLYGHNAPKLPPQWTGQFSGFQSEERAKSGWWGARAPTLNELYTYSKSMSSKLGEYTLDAETRAYLRENESHIFMSSPENDLGFKVFAAGVHLHPYEGKRMNKTAYLERRKKALSGYEDLVCGWSVYSGDIYLARNPDKQGTECVVSPDITGKPLSVVTHYTETFKSQRKRLHRNRKALQLSYNDLSVGAVDPIEQELAEQFKLLDAMHKALEMGYASPIKVYERKIEDISPLDYHTRSIPYRLLMNSRGRLENQEVAVKYKRPTFFDLPACKGDGETLSDFYWQKSNNKYFRWLRRVKNTARSDESFYRQPTFLDIKPTREDRKTHRSARTWYISNRLCHRQAGYTDYECWWLFYMFANESDRLTYELSKRACGISPYSEKSVLNRFAENIRRARRNALKELSAFDTAVAEGVESFLTNIDDTVRIKIAKLTSERIIDDDDPYIRRTPNDKEVAAKLLQGSLQRLVDSVPESEQSYLPLMRGFKKIGGLTVPDYKPLDKRPRLDLRERA